MTQKWLLQLAVALAILEPHTLVFADSALLPVSSNSLPDFSIDGTIEGFKSALQNQIESCRTLNLKEKRLFAKRTVTRQEWCIDTARAFLDLIDSSQNLSEVFAKSKDHFDWYQSVGESAAPHSHSRNVNFTGYFAPVLAASTVKTEQFKFPLYRKPSNLVQVQINNKWVYKKRLSNGTYVAFDTRREIDENHSLKNQNLEIAYVEDLYSAFIFQVQGAGSLEIQQSDGMKKTVILNYAAENGHPYVSIRKVLQEMGVSEEFLTIPGQRRYFGQHPELLLSVLSKNPSYVFFKETPKGPYGVDGIILTPQHSVASDLSIYPAGAIGYMHTQKPIVENGVITGWNPFAWMILNQDTGGAIKGPARIDTYWGGDSYAETAAGTIAQKGGLYYALIQKPKKPVRNRNP